MRKNTAARKDAAKQFQEPEPEAISLASNQNMFQYFGVYILRI